MLAGLPRLYDQTGTFDLLAMKGQPRCHGRCPTCRHPRLFGMLSKSATLPLHTWLPDAGVAPSPVTALLHAAVLVKIGVYVFARLFVATWPSRRSGTRPCSIIAAASALVSRGRRPDRDRHEADHRLFHGQPDRLHLPRPVDGRRARRRRRRSSTSSCTASPRAGSSSARASSSRTQAPRTSRSWAGYPRPCPLTAVAFLFCAFSVMGIPPFGGFFCKVHGDRRQPRRRAGGHSAPCSWSGPSSPSCTSSGSSPGFSWVKQGRKQGWKARADGGLVVVLAVLSLAAGFLVSMAAEWPGPRSARCWGLHDELELSDSSRHYPRRRGPPASSARPGSWAILPGSLRWRQAPPSWRWPFLFPFDASLTLPWLGYGVEISLVAVPVQRIHPPGNRGVRVPHLPLLGRLHDEGAPGRVSSYAWLLITVSMASGAVLANNLVLLLVFWEGLLLTLFG